MPETESDISGVLSEHLRNLAAELLDDSDTVSIQVTMHSGQAMVVIESSAAERLQHSQARFEKMALTVNGIQDVTIIFTVHSQASSDTSARKPRSTPRTFRHRPKTPGTSARESPHKIDQIVAVVSAKGGVGKSTVAVNLAVAASRQGLRVGLLDADIHGPSIPTMLGTADQAHETVNQDGAKLLKPIVAHGLLTASMGHIAQRDQAVVWRGPMVSSALWQLFDQLIWGRLDLLIVDTPPGTGDVLLTLVQKILPSGVVIVTTPQEVALADVARGQRVFTKIGTPVLGVIENMSWYDQAGERIYMFGRGGGQRAADAFGVPLLGRIPIDPAIGVSCDHGRPAVLDDENSNALYQLLVRQIRMHVAPSE